MRILPREEKFFHFFLDQVSIITEASDLLLEGSRAGNTTLTVAAQKIVALEQRGDEVIHEIYEKLNQTFITPIDPEDIHAVGSRLDDVLDGIEEAAQTIRPCQSCRFFSAEDLCTICSNPQRNPELACIVEQATGRDGNRISRPSEADVNELSRGGLP